MKQLSNYLKILPRWPLAAQLLILYPDSETVGTLCENRIQSFHFHNLSQCFPEAYIPCLVGVLFDVGMHRLVEQFLYSGVILLWWNVLNNVWLHSVSLSCLTGQWDSINCHSHLRQSICPVHLHYYCRSEIFTSLSNLVYIIIYCKSSQKSVF